LHRARARGGASGRPIVSVVDAQAPPAEVMTVETADGIRSLGIAAVLDEREAARSAGFAIGADVYADDAPCCGENLRELLLGGVEAQIADENLGRNKALLCVLGLKVRRAVYRMESGYANSDPAR
jgi:hypothetical protein